MKHKMIHFRGYFFLAFSFISLGAFLGIENPETGLPIGLVGVVFLLIGGTKIALRNAELTSERN